MSRTRQQIRIGTRTYTRTVSAIWMQPDGFAETAHGLVTINGETHIVKQADNVAGAAWIRAGQQ